MIFFTKPNETVAPCVSRLSWNVSSEKLPTTFGGIKLVNATLQHAFDHGLAGLILFGFDSREPARASVPPARIASLNLASLAAGRLRKNAA
jgi:hypothetical protein